MSLPKTFSMNAANGKRIEIPSVGFGTWGSPGDEKGWCKQAVLTALKAGYRHIDCAWGYGVQEEVGAAIRESGIPRSEIFLTTKFPPQFGHPDNVEFCLDICLKQFGVEYVDLYLVHWPYVGVPISREALSNAKSGPGTTGEEQGALKKDGKPVIDWEHTPENTARLAGHKGSFLPTWQRMQSLVHTGKTRAIGVSNFTISDMRLLLPYSQSPNVPISCNQIEAHPWLPQTAMLEFAKENDILITCYSPFAGQKKDGETLVKDGTVRRVAERLGMDVGQVLQSWAVGRGTVPLGKSATPERIARNLMVERLGEADVREIDGLALDGGEGRTIDFTEQWGVPLWRDE